MSSNNDTAEDDNAGGVSTNGNNTATAATNNNRQTLEQVQTIREALNKELPLNDDDDEQDAAKMERLHDLLDRLSECAMTVDILAETMIGKVVSGLKSNAALKPKAKPLVSKWKKLVEQQEKAAAAPAAAASAAPNHSAKKAAAAASPPPKKTNVRRPGVARRSSSTAAGHAATAAAAAVVISEEAQSEWADLPGMRQNICKKFYELFFVSRTALIQQYGINEDAIDQLLAPRAAEVENALWSSANKDKKVYADKARSLVFNLRKNQTMTQQVILGQMPSETLVTLKSEDLASDETRMARAKEAKKLIDSKRLDWEQANEAKINEMCGIKGDLLNASLFTCGRCKSTKTTSTQKQTRSADEPMTVFVLCLNCGKRWKC